MNDRPAIRVLNDSPLDGATNMARDEALMTLVGRGTSPPTLRLYQWQVPTISLGYFQRYADYERLPAPAGELPVVRRQTGGGAILHDLELTYSLTLPMEHALLAGGPHRLYEIAHDAVIACFQSLDIRPEYSGFTDDSGAAKGPFFCFERRHKLDVLLEDGKIAGSAQRRTQEAVLQHGSIIVDSRFAQQAVGQTHLPYQETIKQLRELFVQHLGQQTNQMLDRGTWTDGERQAAQELIAKYASDEWTRRT